MKASKREHILAKLRCAIGEFIDRQRRPITLEHLASLTGLSLSYLKKLETGKVNDGRLTYNACKKVYQGTGVGLNCLLKGSVRLPLVNKDGRPYSIVDFEKANPTSKLALESYSLSVQYYAFYYAIRVERCLRMLGDEGKDFLMRNLLEKELQKLEKRFGFDTENPGEDWNDGEYTIDGKDWEYAAKTFSERFGKFWPKFIASVDEQTKEREQPTKIVRLKKR